MKNIDPYDECTRYLNRLAIKVAIFAGVISVLLMIALEW